jgi:hypothetical protein
MPLDAKTKKRNQREREKAALEKYGGKRVSFLAYGDTVKLLELECERLGFKGQQRYAEVLTHILHLRDTREKDDD